MVIGCCRSNEVDETHSFSKAVRDLRQRLNEGMEGVYEITDISIGNLDVEATRGVLSDLLSTEENQLDDLAQVCHDKTQGNAFFLMSFIHSLYQNQFLEFNLGKFEWEYDIEEIKAGTGSTDNVAEMVKERMGTLEADSLLVVKLAGCLGARFQYDILEILYTTFSNESESALDFGSVILNLIQESILQTEGSFLRWVHDSIQGRLALLSLLCPPLLHSSHAVLFETCSRRGGVHARIRRGTGTL